MLYIISKYCARLQILFLYYRGLKNIHFEIISGKIIQIFPSEVASAYYIAPQTDGPYQKIAKGKLVDRYRNRVRELRHLGIVESPKNIQNQINEEIEIGKL